MANTPDIKHLAIIMDGNGRWAKKRMLPIVAGHKKGAEAAKEITKACIEFGISYLTLYTFSSENWNRSEEEVKNLLNLLKFYLGDEAEEMARNGIKLKFIGDISAFSDDIKNRAKELEDKTAFNKRLTVNIALNYGGRQEIVQAANRAIEQGKSITVEEFGNLLYTSESPDPDLLIRTGDEVRLSNFLLWQAAYTELYFTETLWPDFGREELQKALGDFKSRERRFGGRKSS